MPLLDQIVYHSMKKKMHDASLALKVNHIPYHTHAPSKTRELVSSPLEVQKRIRSTYYSISSSTIYSTSFFLRKNMLLCINKELYKLNKSIYQKVKLTQSPLISDKSNNKESNLKNKIDAPLSSDKSNNKKTICNIHLTSKTSFHLHSKSSYKSLYIPK